MLRACLRAVAFGGLCVGMVGLVAAPARADVKSPTMDAIKKRGQLVCGIDTGIPGYAFQDSKGEWQGLDVAYCRAIADAVLGSPTRSSSSAPTSKVRFSVLQSGEIDVLIRDSELTFMRNTQLGLDEPAVNFYTAQTFMVRKSLNVAHAKDLNGATICLLTGTTLETNIADYNRANGIKIKTLLFDKPEEAFAAADAGRCDGYTDDGGSVAAARSTMKKPDDWMFIPETIGGLQPLGPFTRLGDQGWSRLVKWVQNAMVEGEVAGRHQGQRRPDQGSTARIRRCGAISGLKATSASCSASTTRGPIASPRISATTARSTTPTSAQRRAGIAARHEQPLHEGRAVHDATELALT